VLQQYFRADVAVTGRVSSMQNVVYGRGRMAFVFTAAAAG